MKTRSGAPVQPHIEEMIEDKYNTYKRKRRDKKIRDGSMRVPVMTLAQYAENYLN